MKRTAMRKDWLSGRTVVVAGATGAIGSATCSLLLSHGATVIALGRNLAKLALLKGKFKTRADRFHFLVVDGCDQHAWERVLKNGSKINSEIDAFIHAAGQVVPGAFLELTPDEINSIIETNFRSVVTAAGVIIPLMVERRKGHFIVVGSLGGIVPMPYETMYSATKFALRGFCLSLHEELRPQGVTVSLISPGPVRSPMLDLEGTDPRAALTFVDTPVEPARIAQNVVCLLKSRKREIVRPPLQRFAGFSVSIFPAVFGTMYPLLAALGRRRLLKYRRTLLDSEHRPNDHRQSI